MCCSKYKEYTQIFWLNYDKECHLFSFEQNIFMFLKLYQQRKAEQLNLTLSDNVDIGYFTLLNVVSDPVKIRI